MNKKCSIKRLFRRCSELVIDKNWGLYSKYWNLYIPKGYKNSKISFIKDQLNIPSIPTVKVTAIIKEKYKGIDGKYKIELFGGLIFFSVKTIKFEAVDLQTALKQLNITEQFDSITIQYDSNE